MKWENDTFALVQRMRAMVYSSKDFESLWFLYQAEGLPKNISIEEFLDKPSGKAERCEKQGVPVNEFNKWYRDTHKRIHPIRVDGVPSGESKESSGDAPIKEVDPVRIAVTICMSNGVFVKRKNLRHT